MSNEIIKINETTVLEAFTNNDGLEVVIEEAKNVVNDFEHDMKNGASRQRTASLAQKVRTLKTRLDGMGKDLTSDWAKKKKAVDANRKSMREALDDLSKEARKPLTDWEDAEKLKAAQIEAEKLKAQVESDHEIALLMDKEVDRLREEAKQAELKRIEKEKKEREDKIRKEVEEAAQAKIKSDMEKIQKEKEEAIKKSEEAAKELIAQKKKEEKDKAAAIIAQEKAVKDAEDKAIAEMEQKKRDDEEAVKKREKDRKHAGNIMKQTKESLMEHANLSEESAKLVVLAIKSGSIANVDINF